MAVVRKFWTDFVKDPAKLQLSQSFPLLLWQGITDSVRKSVWCNAALRFHAEAETMGRPAGGRARDPEPLAAETVAEIEASVRVELEHAIFTQLAQRSADAPVRAVQDIVLEHARRTGRSSYEQGTAQLASTLLQVTQDAQAARDLLYHLTERMSEYVREFALRRDTLVLADLLVQEVSALCEHWNQCRFDVVDLSDVATSWVESHFACFFPQEAVVRLVDISLFEGPERLVGFCFGVFCIFADQLRSAPSGAREEEAASSSSEMFRLVTELPATMTRKQINEALKIGYETVRVGEKRINSMRAEKDWQVSMRRAGVLSFFEGVGDPNVMAETSEAADAMDSGAAPAAVAASRSASSLTAGAAGAGTGASGNGSRSEKDFRIITDAAESLLPEHDVLARLGKHRLLTLDAALKRLLEDAQRRIVKQQEQIETLQGELKSMEGNYSAGNSQVSVNASSVESSVSSVASALEEANNMGSGDESETEVSLSAAHEQAPTVDHPRGTVPYSKLFQYQQFPCLYMEGYLLKARKKGLFTGRRNSTGWFGNLQRRFFVLQGSFLTYFKSHRTSTPSKDLSVDMRKRKVSRVDRHKLEKFGFEISEVDNEQCLFLLFASNTEERNVWIQVLNAAAES